MNNRMKFYLVCVAVGIGSVLMIRVIPRLLFPPPQSTATPSPVAIKQEDEHSNLIQINSPTKESEVTSPLKVTGKARGTWFSEASFPVKLLDENGNEIAKTTAKADGEWMTIEFVPFSAELTFTAPATQKGTLILAKDNPSGKPENDDELRIPVRFK